MLVKLKIGLKMSSMFKLLRSIFVDRGSKNQGKNIILNSGESQKSQVVRSLASEKNLNADDYAAANRHPPQDRA